MKDIGDRFIRICYNTEDWQFPTGDARDLEVKLSFAAMNGYGHEEWLFRYEWMLSGYDRMMRTVIAMDSFSLSSSKLQHTRVARQPFIFGPLTTTNAAWL